MDELLTPGGRRDVASTHAGDDDIPVTPSTRKDGNDVESKVRSLVGMGVCRGMWKAGRRVYEEGAPSHFAARLLACTSAPRYF